MFLELFKKHIESLIVLDLLHIFNIFCRKQSRSSSSSSSSDEDTKSREKKIDEVDRLAELERVR